MERRRRSAALIAVAGLLLFEPLLPQGANLVSTPYNQFGLDLFHQLRREKPSDNIFISPLSIAMALQMTYNGAAGKTADAMARTLKLTGTALPQANQAASELLQKLRSSDPKVEFLIANSLWARSGVRFNEDFLASNRKYFGAEIASLDFGSPQALSRINGWVDANTKGKIPRIIERIDAQTVMFLINAVYFKGRWQTEFDRRLTANTPFHIAASRQKQVAMMARSGSFQYLRGERFQAIGLPYGNGSVSLYVFLPDAGLSINDFLSRVNDQTWNQWMSAFRRAHGDVKIPRFKMEYGRDLKDSLKALGMGIAFDNGKADFSGMRRERDLFIQQVTHKSLVEVNEEGTTAAAATSIAIGVTSVMVPSFTFVADRPFLMAIRDQTTGVILFLGAVYDPQ
jgi:serpin B